MPSTISGDANVSATEFGYLDGVTSALQTQINSKLTTPGAWTSYTPTVTALSGTFTSVSASGAYSRAGNIVTVRATVNITTNGTAASGVVITVPVASTTGFYVGTGRETAATGNQLQVFRNSNSDAIIQKYDGSYVGGNGYSLSVSFTYEAA